MLPLQALYYRNNQYNIYMWEEYSLVETQSAVEFLLCQVNNFARVRYRVIPWKCQPKTGFWKLAIKLKSNIF